MDSTLFNILVIIDDSSNMSHTVMMIFSILKFEERTVGDCAMLCVKNITKNEFAKFSAEARGETCEAKLNEKLPFVGKMDSVSGLAGDIEVFMVQVQPATHVSWFKGSTKITKQNFR